MNKVKYQITILILILSQILFGVQKLEFSKKRNFYFGEGEYGKIKLQVKNYETYDYKSQIIKPFVLKKGNNGIIELIFDIRLIDDSEKVIDNTYKAGFTFEKKVIGKKERIYLSAVYKPEIQIIENDTLYTTYTQVELSPDKPTAAVQLNSIKNYYSSFKADYDKNLMGILSDTNLKFNKGINTIEISLARSENFEKEIMLYRPVGKSKINQLYITVKSTGFEAVVDTPVIDNTDTDSADVEGMVDPVDQEEEYSDNYEDNEYASEESSGAMNFILIIIIVVLCVVIAVLILLLLIGKKGGMYDKYETFFYDIAEIVNVEPKGNNIDKVIEEMMMVLLERFETPFGKEAKKEKTVSEPAPAKSISIKKTSVPEETKPLQKEDPAESLDDLDLDFGSDEKKEEPSAEKKQIFNSGFDFDDSEGK